MGVPILLQNLRDDPLVSKRKRKSDAPRIPRRTKRTIWNTLFSFTKRSHLPLLLAAVALAIVAGLVHPALTIFLGRVFGAFNTFSTGLQSSSDFLASLATSCLGLAVIGVLSFLLNGGALAGWVAFGEKQAQSARHVLFESLADKSVPWYDEREDGVSAFVVGCSTQIRELQVATSQPFGQAIQGLATMVASLSIAFAHSWQLTLVILACWPATFTTLILASARIEKALELQKSFILKATQAALDAVHLIDLVKIYNGQPLQAKNYGDASASAATAYFSQARWNGAQLGMVNFVAQCMFVAGFWYGATLFRNGQVSAEDIVTTFWACSFAAVSLNVLSQQSIPLQQGLGAAVNLHKLVAVKTFSRIKSSRMKKPELVQGDIELIDISFSYPSRPQVKILDDVSMWFPAGDTTFVLGQSGSGKSTLSSLLLGFYQTGYGQIFVDDHPIHTYDIDHLRENITVVQQNSALLKGTILENLQVADPELGPRDLGVIREACRFAEFLETVDGLPEGMNTELSNDIVRLSGGQEQRLALARAKLRDTPVLILDESTSALDELTRTRLMDRIRDWRKNRTTIIITHELSQIREEDFVYVISRGQVRQEGYRRHLHGKPGVFQRFSPLQSEKRGLERPEPTQRPLSIHIERPPLPVNPLMSPANPKESFNFHVPRRSMFQASVFGQAPGSRLSVLFPPRPSSPLLSPLESVVVEVKEDSMLDIEAADLNEDAEWPLPSLPERPSLQHSIMSEALVKGKSAKPLPSRPILRDRWSGALPRLSKTRAFVSNDPLPTAPRMYTVKQILSTVFPSTSRRQHVMLFIGSFAALVHASTSPVFGYLLAKLLSAFNDTTTLDGIARAISLAMLVIAFIDGVAVFFEHYLFELVGESWVDKLREQAFGHVMDQPKSWFEQNRNAAAKIAETLDKHAEETRNFVGRFSGSILIAVFTLAVSLIWSLAIGPRLTGVAIAASLVLVAASRLTVLYSEGWEGRTSDAHEQVGEVMRETFTKVRFVRAYNLESKMRNKTHDVVSKALKVGINRALVSGLCFGLQEALILFIMALLFYYGGVLASDGTLSVPTVLQTLSVLIFGVTNLQLVISSIPQITTSKDNASRLLRLVHLPSASHEHTGIRRDNLHGDIVFRDVCFRYPSRPESLILNHLNLTISFGECIAIAGASGSGKSTLLSLLSRLRAPTSGEVLLADYPTTTQLASHLRSQIAYVPQSVTLFDSTIADNILYGLNTDLYSNQDLLAVAQAVGLYDWIATLPLGYTTPVGEGGQLVSGGQAQRIAIARAVVRAPKVLVLDECTSNLDEENAAGVRAVVRGLMDGRSGMTVVVVTHDREMMRMADRVAVLRDGRLAEEGSFEELSGRGGELTRILGEEVQGEEGMGGSGLKVWEPEDEGRDGVLPFRLQQGQ